jgi:hypothetical protein
MDVEKQKMQNMALFLDEYLNQIGNKKFDSTDEFMTFKKGTFNIRLDAYFYKTKDTVYYAYIYPTDEKLLIDNIKIEPIKKGDNTKPLESARLIKIKEKIEKGDLKLVVGESIVGQLARIAVMGLKSNWILILIIAVAVGIGCGGSMYAIGLNNGISQGFNNAQHIYNSTIPFLYPSITPNPSPIIIG